MENQDTTAWPLDREAYFLRCCREARERQGMSQRELSRRLQDEFGVTLPQSSIAKLEREGDDRRPVRLAEAIALSLVLQVPLWDVFTDLNDPEFWQTTALERRRSELMEGLRRTIGQIGEVETALFARTWNDRMLVHPHWSMSHGVPTPVDDVMRERGIGPEELPDRSPEFEDLSGAMDALATATNRFIEKHVQHREEG